MFYHKIPGFFIATSMTSNFSLRLTPCLDALAILDLAAEKLRYKPLYLNINDELAKIVHVESQQGMIIHIEVHVWL